jgi:ElaB/YqjD/DUF883 family membrane-anchored ribosome-binding protein
METLDRVTNTAHDAYDKVAQVTNQAVDTLSDKSQQLRSTEERLVKDCRGYISKNPIASVGIAAAVGYVFGRLLNQR